ncbi:MAG: serine hydrolase domain-containing protein [Candidatus Marinimicrobia bacterium]|jgi:CubicO group peptidase (beta-lactamase class C family)|nr:serine hydrolase domain-containing protein [Candidatus Neomarinimicrobiota bacterium]
MNNFKLKNLLILSLLFVGCESSTYGPKWSSAIDDIANEAMNTGKVAGISVGVAYGDSEFFKGYGKADLELDVATPDNAIYEIGSVTKQFTAASIIKLAEEGKIDLNADIRKYLGRDTEFPDKKGYNTQGHIIPVIRLLDHTSGIKGYTEMPSARPLFVQDLPRDSLVSLFSEHPFDFPPGEQMIYNNSAYFLAGLIIEKVSGKTYADYVEENFFKPLGMDNSSYCSNQAIWKNRAHGYDTDKETGGMIHKGYIVHSVPYAAGSLCSTVRDLVKWNQALHKGGILSNSVYRQMITPGQLNDGTVLRYAQGLSLTKVANRKAIHHGGGINGFLSQSLYFPEEDLTVVVLVNTAGPISPSQLAENIATKILGDLEEDENSYNLSANALQQFSRIYTGVARGRKVNVEISDNGKDLTYIIKRADKKSGEAYAEAEEQPQPKVLEYRGEGIFRDGRTIFIFSKKLDELRIDFGGGYSILKSK